MAEVVIDYQFKFEDETVKEFKVYLDVEALLSRLDNPSLAQDWTRLDFQKCKHCPYSSAEKPQCPVAVNLATVAHAFKEEKSFRKTTVFVRTADRIFGKATDLQTGLQSLFGLVMATSGCVHLRFFQPMTLFHLPFATYQETIVRVVGQYLIQQLLKEQDGKEPDWKLSGLAEIYGNINLVNQGMMNRIRAIAKGDADKNAIVILDSFASLLPVEMDNGFEALKEIYHRFL